MQLIDHALTYAAWGWKIFPLMPRSKKPFPGSRGFLDASDDAERVRAWWAKYPNANIGLATGPASGVVVVDLDVRPTEGKDGVEEWAKLSPAIETARSATGGGGQQLFFLAVPGFRNRKISQAVETRGDGGYVVLPPSIHPSGQAYQWLDDPELTPPAELPAFLLPDAAGNLAGLVDSAAKASKPEPMEALKRCRRYLDTLPPAISGQGGHNATFRVAAECFRFGLTDSQAWDLLSGYNDTRCHPKWSERELRHKLKSARAQVDKEGKFGARLTEGAEAEEWPVIVIREREPREPNDIPDSVEPQPASLPATMLEPPGVVGEICRWMNATAYKPQPILSLGNALAFWGAVLGQIVRTPSNLRTNLYCLGVGESGCGKDHSRQCVKRICDAAGVTEDLLGGEEVASDSAILDAVHKHGSVLFQFDEIGHMLSQANSKYAAAHMRNITPTFMRLFSSANTKLIGKEYAGRGRKDIDQPNACLYGTTVPDRLFNGLTRFDITDGFLGRMLVFISRDADPEEREKEPLPVPDSIRIAVEEWRRRRFDDPKKRTHNLTPERPITIDFDDEATATLARFAAECRASKAACRDGSGMDALWARAAEHARKVALVIACGCDFPHPVVTGDISQQSVNLVSHLTTTLMEAVRANVADSEFHRIVQRVMGLILKAGHAGITRKDLARKTQGMNRRAREDAIAELLESGEIAIAETPSATKPTRTLIAQRFAEKGQEKSEISQRVSCN